MENIFSVSQPFVSFARALGVFPMSYDGPPRKGFLRTTWRDVIISCSSLSVLTFVIIFNLTEAHSSTVTTSKLLETAWILRVNSKFWSYCLLICFQIYKRKNISTFLWLLYNFDKNVSVNMEIYWNHLQFFNDQHRQNR